MRKGKFARRFASVVSVVMAFALLFTFFVGCNKNKNKTEQTDKMSDQFVTQLYNEKDLYHDQAYSYMSPLEPTANDAVTLRLKCLYGSTRSAKIWYTENVGSNCSFSSVDMRFEKSDVNRKYEYWVGTIPASGKTRRYHFSLTNDKETVYYTFQGIFEEPVTSSDVDWLIMPDFKTPDWSKGTVWYSAMPDSFFNGNVLNDKTGGTFADAWGNYHTSMGGYFGGDYDGLEAKIDYLKQLGADSLFINPIWITTHQAGYGAFDFMQSDSAFGSEEMLIRLTEALHEQDMEIMLDGVFEYINVSNILYNQAKNYPYLDGALSPDDTWYDFVQRNPNGEAIYSQWGSPLINFSSETVRDYVYRNPDSVMQYYIREVGIDGWRMDVGNALSGSDKNNFGTSTQILRDMRKYVKQADEDALFLSEHANGDQFDYILDSKWNYSFGYAIRDWAAGLSNPSVLMKTLENGVLGLPRSVANSSYNFLTTHDLPRLLDIANYEGGDKTSTFNAANLLMFTFVGSPCIYYGEEIGMHGQHVIEDTKAQSFWNSMDWDETDVNYEIYNMTKALGSLRREYPAVFKDGAYMNICSETGVNNPAGIISFARFGEGGSVISAVNPTNSVVKGFTLDIGKLDIKNGTTLTDYLTGRTYTVVDGKVTIDVYPGGSVLVTGGASAGAVGGMLKGKVGNAEFSAVALESGISVSGNGTVAGSSDNFGFVYNNVFGNSSASVTLGEGDYILMLRDGFAQDDAFYGVKISGNKVRALTRKGKGESASFFTTRQFAAGDVVTVERSDENTFCYTVNGKQYDITAVDADYYMYAGICVSGKATVKGFRYSQEAQQRSTAFENGIGSFTYVDGAYTANGGLTLLGANGKSALYAPIEMCDFTVKTQLSSAVSSGYAGIGIGFADDYIFLGRHAGRIIAAHVTDGDYAVYGSIGDVSGSVTLQLEKVANAYRAVAIDGNGNVTVVAEDILANYSKVEAMLVASDCDAGFGYLSFGDDINGREGFASFIAQGKIDFSLTSSSSLYQYNVFGGSWQYVIGGIEQTDKTAENAHYAYTAGALSSFRATFALRAEFAGEGSFVQAMWGKPSAGSDQGYAIKITPDGKAVLIDSRSGVLDEYVIEGFEQGADYDFTVSVSGSNAFVYFGTDEKLILSSPVAGGKGYFGWKGSFASFAITSYGVYSADGNYTVLSGAINVFRNEHVQGGTDIEISGAGSNYGYVSLKKTTVANFATSFNLQLTRTSLISRGRFRVYIGGKSGYNSLRSGLIFQLDDRGRITIYEDGEKKVDNYEAKKFDTQSCYIVLAYVDGVLNVYQADYKEDLNYSRKDIEKIYTYKDSFCRSGALSFYTNNASVRMCNIRAMAVDRDEDYTKGVLFTDYFIDSPPAPEPEIVSAPAKVGYENDFSDKMTLGDFTRYSGAISISDGMLIVDGIYGNNWDAGTGLAYGTFENFELKVKVNVQNAFGFGAIEFNKASPSVNHQQSAITLMITNSGASLYLGNDVYQPGSSVGVVHGENGFIDVTLRVENGVITYDLGAESASFKISELKRNNLYSGFISFNAGSNKVYFDDLKITLL